MSESEKPSNELTLGDVLRILTHYNYTNDCCIIPTLPKASVKRSDGRIEHD